MSIPYFPLYIDDYEAATAHLTLAEDGAYMRLLRMCWRTPGCKIPSDRKWIFRRLRAHTEADQEVLEAVIDEFFETKSGFIFNRRLTKEFEQANSKSQRRKLAGSKGGSAKALKNNNTDDSNATDLLKQPEPEPEPKKKEANASQKKPPDRGSRLPADWVLPRAWGSWAVEQGVTAGEVRTEADTFRDYWHSVSGAKGIKADWQATWRNWIRKNLKDRGPRQRTPEAEDFWSGKVLT